MAADRKVYAARAAQRVEFVDKDDGRCAGPRLFK